MSTVTDPIADLIARLRNGAQAQKIDIFVPYSRIKVTNKLVDRACAITGLKRVSRPGLRRYVGANEIPRVLGGMGVAILSTPRGVLSGREAKKQKVGGELLAYIW